MQRLLVQGIDIIRKAGQVQVEHRGGAVVFLPRIGFAAGAQQIHRQGLDISRQPVHLVAGRGILRLVFEGDGAGQGAQAIRQALAEVTHGDVHGQAQQDRQPQQTEHKLQLCGTGGVGADGDHDLARDVRFYPHRCPVLPEVLAQCVSRLPQGLALYIKNRHLFRRGGFDEALQRGDPLRR